MKALTLNLVAIILFVLAPMAASSQIKGILRDKAFEAIKSIEPKEEKPVEKTEPEVQSQPERQAAPKQKAKPGLMERRMMQAMGLNNVKYDQNYSFASSMVMDIETVDSLKNKEKTQYTTFFSPNDKSFAMVFDAVDKETGAKQRSTMIFDMKNWAMLILAEKDGERSGIALSMPADTASTQDNESVNELPEGYVHPWYTPTGKSKSIAGFTCKEYTHKTNEGSVNLWITDDKKVNLSKAYGHLNGLQSLASGGWSYGMGMVMEMIFNDSRTGASTHMMVKDLNLNSSKALDISGYQIIGIGEAQK